MNFIGNYQRSESHPSAGFTLLEILVALLILSGGLTLVLRSSHSTLGALARTSEQMRAGLLLRESQSAWLAGQNGGGVFTGSLGDYEWDALIDRHSTAFDIPDVVGTLSEVTFTVRRLNGVPIRSGTTLRFDPRVQ